jgi:tetratricopeptide (TPR) repeat protein
MLNIGIKRFAEGKHSDALTAFSESLRLYPNNALAYWNVARLGIVTGRDRQQVVEDYSQAVKASSDARIRSRIKDESVRYEQGSIDESHKTPVCEADMARQTNRGRC